MQGSIAAVIAGTTIAAGGSPSSTGGALISIHPGASGIVVNGESHPLSVPVVGSPTAPFVITAGVQTISGIVQGSTAAVVAGTTIAAGGLPSSINGAFVSVHPGAYSIAVNGESQSLPKPVPAPVAAASPLPLATVGSQIITASPGASEVYYAGTTFSQNGPHATIDGTDVYVGTSGLIVSGSSTVAIPVAPSSGFSYEGEPGVVTFTAADHTFTFSPSGIAVAGTTIQSGSVAVISSTTISYGPSGLVIGTYTIQIPTPPPQTGSGFGSLGAGPTYVFTLGGQTFTANPTAVIVSGTTLTDGGSAITISGTPISLGSSGIVIASSALPIPPGALPSSTMVVTGETFTIKPTAIEIGGTTLSEGGLAITVSGTPISLCRSDLVIAGSTVPCRSGPLTGAGQKSQGIGGATLAGFGPSSTSTPGDTLSSTPGVVSFAGKAAFGKSLEPLSLLGSLVVGAWVICIGMWI